MLLIFRRWLNFRIVSIMLSVYVLLSLQACSFRKGHRPTQVTHHEIKHFIPDSPMIIYQTRADYSQYVPVRMNAERTKIISFPLPHELHFQGIPLLPTPLNKGFRLDNIGIGPDVAFLKFTIRQYILLLTPPPVEVMMQHILDSQPLVAMFQCGYRYEYTDLIRDVNVLIERGLTNCLQVPIPYLNAPVSSR